MLHNGCEFVYGHLGPHEATFLLCEASPDWTGSPEQWAAFRANPPRWIDPEASDGWDRRNEHSMGEWKW